MFTSVRKFFSGILTGAISKLEKRVYRNVVLPPGFVLPSKRGESPRSDGSQSADGGSGNRGNGKSVRFLLPASQAGVRGQTGLVVVTPLDSPREKKRGKLKRRKKRRKHPNPEPVQVTSTSLQGNSSPSPSRKSKPFLPGLLSASNRKNGRGSGSDSDSDASTSSRRRRRRRSPSGSARSRSRPSSPGTVPTSGKQQRASTPPGTRVRRTLRGTRSSPVLAVPRLWDSDSESGSDVDSPRRGRRSRRVPRTRSALSVTTTAVLGDDDDDEVVSDLFTMASLKRGGRPSSRGAGVHLHTRNGSAASSRRKRMYLPSQVH